MPIRTSQWPIGAGTPTDRLLRRLELVSVTLQKLVALLIFLVMFSLGCDRTQELANQKRETSQGQPATHERLASIEDSAARLLERCSAAYARLTHYSDAGRVVLSYKIDGQSTRDVAPLAVAYEQPNRIGIQAYQVRAATHDDRFRMRILGDDLTPISRQVVSRAIPAHVDLHWLLLDSIARYHMASGLAGAPPQLELLLGQTPFAALLQPDAKAMMDGQGSEGDKNFYIIKIVRGEARYRLWIDSVTTLLRRIELPTSSLPPAMLSDSHISDVHLSIEFDKVNTVGPIHWSAWSVPNKPLDQLVRYFVAPPALNLDSRLGKAIPAFRLDSVTQDAPGLDTSRQASDGRVQVLVWAADHPSCQTMIQQLEQAIARLPESVRSHVSMNVVWAEPKSANGTTFDTLGEKWRLKTPIVIDKQALGRDVLGVAQAPTVVLLDSKHRLQYFGEGGNPLLSEAIGEMLTRVVSGESLAETMLTRAKTERDHYDHQLWLARARDASDGSFNKPGVYPTSLVELKPLATRKLGVAILALESDAAHNVWLLTNDGQLECRDSSDKLLKQFNTGIDAKTLSAAMSASSAASTWSLAIDDGSRWVAIGRCDSADLLVFDCQENKLSSVPMTGAALVDYRWLKTSAGARLAAITNKGRTILIDPQRAQQHSGQTPSAPIALLDRTSSETLASGYVILDDGRVEPIIVEDQTVKGLAKPASTPIANNSAATNRRLKFTPASGTWRRLTGGFEGQGAATLALGRLADDEPAVFMLDENLQQHWHAPLPLHRPSHLTTAAALAPENGQPLWVVSQDNQTLHFMRGDGQMIDHCQLDQPVTGLALTPFGNSLVLWLARSTEVERLQVIMPK